MLGYTIGTLDHTREHPEGYIKARGQESYDDCLEEIMWAIMALGTLIEEGTYVIPLHSNMDVFLQVQSMVKDFQKLMEGVDYNSHGFSKLTA